MMPSTATKPAEPASQNGPFSSFPTTSHLQNSESTLFPPRRSSRRPSNSSAQNDSVSPSLTSKPSSSSMLQNMQHLPSRSQIDAHWLKSQYPQEEENSHVEFILVAAFDIDRGSVMEHQYPGPISGDESMLAELMLPDQSHRRQQDWTIFFLHKDTTGEGDGESPSKADFDTNGERTEDASHEDEQEAEDMLEGPPLIYVLNLVNRKYDDSAKRGAVVKAMAICTRHSFVDIFKPVLVLAIEEYFKAPTLGTLEMLFNSLNAMDLSLMPRLSLLERIILQASNAKDMFVEKFERMIEQKKEEEQRANPNSSASPEASTATQAGTSRFVLPKDTHEFESRIHFNNHSIPVKIPTAKSSETVGSFSVIKLIHTFAGNHASSPQPFALHPHLTTCGAYTHPIIVLVNSMLTQKRIVFIGHGKASEEVAEAVLAACSLVSGGILRGFTRHAFPYTDLTKVDDLQKVPGFIAGVTNPVFSGNPQWWDLLCDLSTGRMKISNAIEQPQITEGWLSFQQQNPSVMSLAGSGGPGPQSQDATGDAAFMDNVLRSISNRLGEGVIRRMWREWIHKLTRIAAAFEEIVYGTSALYIGGEQADEGAFGLSGHGYVWPDEASRLRELAGNVSRIEGWRHTRSYYNFKRDLIHLYNSRPIRTVDLNYHHDRLRTQKLGPNESAAIFQGFSAAVYSHAEICQLLVTTSESYGGLFYLSLGLIHPLKDVRFKTVELLERVARHEAGKHYWDSLGRFAKLAFFRLRREMETNIGRNENELSKITSLTEGSSN